MQAVINHYTKFIQDEFQSTIKDLFTAAATRFKVLSPTLWATGNPTWF